jgi:hypothetical protein
MTSVSAPELCFRSADLAARGLGSAPDGVIGSRWPPMLYLRHPILYLSAGGRMARLDPNGGTPNVLTAVRGLPAEFDYCAGGAGLINNTINGHWLCVAHAERKPKSGHFWGNLAWITSPDYGATWQWLGVFVEPERRYQDPNNKVCEIGGGALAWAGEWLYVYFRETTAAGAGRQSMAYARAIEVFRAAADGWVSPWRKWGGGPVPDDADPPAVGGGLGVQLGGLPAETDWCDARWHAGLRKFVMFACPFAEARISPWVSDDGLDWRRLAGPYQDDGFHFYPSIVPLNYGEQFVRDAFWLYYVKSRVDVRIPGAAWDWRTAETWRRLVVLG